MSANTSMAIQSKALMILTEQMNMELAAYKKAAHYAQTFEEPALKTLASTVANRHKTRFDKLSGYLSSHAQ